MPKIAVYNISGKKVEDLELSSSVFGVPSNDSLLHQVYVSAAANARKVIAHTKGRGEVSGSGKKPWRQKGTGNARVGSVRTPVWRKGGVVFGPTKERNFSKSINLKMKRRALVVALSEKVRNKKLTVLRKMELVDKKTKAFASCIKNLKLEGNILFGFSDDEKELRLYSRNLSRVRNVLTRNLNVNDVLNFPNLVLSKLSIEYLENKFGGKK